MDRPDLYPPSWIDRLEAWIDTLPVPAAVVYLGVFLSVAVSSQVIAWVEGYVAVGVFSAFWMTNAFVVVIGFGGIHLLDRMAARAWSKFRPLTSLSDEEAGRIGYELTTMPVRPAIVCLFLGVVTAVTLFALQYGRPFDLARGPITFVVGLPATGVAFAGTWALIYHSFHQLAVIGRAYRYIESIDLLHLERSHAFATVTAATGLVLLALGYIGPATNPDAPSNPQIIAWTVLTTVAAVACFVVPLNGIHELIAAEKSRRLETVERLLDGVLDDLHRRAERGDVTDASAVNDQITSLLTEREVLARVSTWPWSPGTLRGFGTAIVLPIVLWLVFRVLDQLLA